MTRRSISLALLAGYGAVLVDVLVFKYIPAIRIGHLMLKLGGGAVGPANFVPFRTIVRYLFDANGGGIALLELVGNIIPLIPIGFLVPFVYRTMTWQRALLLSAAVGFAIEGMQALFRVGIFDIDDVILNGLGVMVGYLAFRLFIQKAHAHE